MEAAGTAAEVAVMEIAGIVRAAVAVQAGFSPATASARGGQATHPKRRTSSSAARSTCQMHKHSQAKTNFRGQTATEPNKVIRATVMLKLHHSKHQWACEKVVPSKPFCPPLFAPFMKKFLKIMLHL